MVLVVLDVRLHLGGRVLVRREQSHLAKLESKEESLGRCVDFMVGDFSWLRGLGFYPMRA